MTRERYKYRNIRKILVKGTNWVGDTIMSFPAVYSLRRLFPHAHISVLVRFPLDELWKANPAIDEVIPYTMPAGVRRLSGELGIARLIKQREMDLAVIFPRSFSSALMVFWGGIPHRIGYASEGRSWLLTDRIGRTEELLQGHRMHYYLRLIETMGRISLPPHPSLTLNGTMGTWASGFLSQHGMTGKRLVAFNPGATYGAAKSWPPERFAELGRRLVKDYGASILIFGAARPQEKALNDYIAKSIGTGCLNLSGRTSLLELAALLRLCRLLVTNDTGTMHIAAAVGTRTVAIFGPTDPRTTAPLGKGHVIIREDVSCSPCLKRVCPEDHRCMELIGVDNVYKKVSMQLIEKSHVAQKKC
jgi:heptosyltransferase-2